MFRIYSFQNWIRLKADTHIELARVYQELEDQERFIEAAAHIAAYPSLDHDLRMEFFSHLLNYIPPTEDVRAKTIASSEMIHLEGARIEYDETLQAVGVGPGQVLCDSTVRVHLEVTSKFPATVDCRELIVTLKTVKSNVTETKTGTKKASTGSEPNPPIIEAPSTENRKPFAPTAVLMKEQQHLKQDGGLSSVALVCQNTHQLLSRKISCGLPLMDSSATREEFTHCFRGVGMRLEPGVNHVTLEMKAECEGQFVLNQFIVAVHRLELIEPVGNGPTDPAPGLTVVRVTPTVTIVKCREDLLAGIEQEIQLVIRTGSAPFKQVRQPEIHFHACLLRFDEIEKYCMN